jgi:ATP-binding cassette, subfamily C (CFTR/MRP), member 1
VIAAGIAVLQIANLALWAKQPITRVAIGAGILELLCAFAVVVLVIFEHKRTIRPSKVTSVYLLSALVADCVLLRTLYKRGYAPRIPPVISASASCKLLLLLVESWPKTSYLNPTGKPYGPVDVAGPFNKAFLWWLNPLLLLGNRKILSLPDLCQLDHELYSESLRVRMQKAWDACA